MSTSYSLPRIFSLFHIIGLTWGCTVVAPQLRAAGPEPVDLGSAAHFTILAGAAITTTGGGIINGDIGASPIAGTAIHLTAAQVNGTIYTVDANGPAGSVTAPALLLAAKGDLMTAMVASDGRALAFTAGVTYNGTGGTLPLPKVPVFTDIRRTDDGDVTVVLRTTPFYKLTLQTSVNLTLPIWTTVTTDTPDAVTWSWTHPAPLATGPRRYYRAFLAP